MSSIEFPRSSPIQGVFPQPQHQINNREANTRERSPVQNLASVLNQNPQTTTLKWNEKAIRHLDGCEAYLDAKLPNLPIQNKIDKLGRYIEAKFAPLKKFNEWLDSNGEGEWYKKLATFLAKLPARAVRNIVRLLYNIIKAAIYAAVHPAKAAVKLAKLLVELAHALTLPETWSKMGAGMIGASLGQSLVSGNPIPLIAFGIGAAMLIGGLTAGAIKSAVEAEKGNRGRAAMQNLLDQGKQLPEAALTGFCMGLITGGIQRAIQSIQMNTLRFSSIEDAERYAQTFIKQHNLPQYQKIELDPSGRIIIEWKGGDSLGRLSQTHPNWLAPAEEGRGIVDDPLNCRLYLKPHNPSVWADHWVWDGFEGGLKPNYIPKSELGLGSNIFPKLPENAALTNIGPTAGVVATRLK